MFSPQSLQLPKAAQRKFTHNISCQHLTTLDFGILRPVFSRVLNPNEKISVNPSLLGRVSPMAYPVLGDISVIQRAFFVPYRLISPVWLDFVRLSNGTEDTLGFYGQGQPSIPTVKASDFVEAFIASCYPADEEPLPSDTNYNYYLGARTIVQTGSSFTGEYDLKIPHYNDSTPQLIDRYYYIKLSPQGKIVLSLLQSLGYEFAFVSNHREMVQTFSLLPLFAYLKVYKDWFTDTRYSDELSYLFKTASITSGVGEIGGELFTNENPDFTLNVCPLFSLILDCSYSLLPPDVFNSSSINSGLINDSSLGNLVHDISVNELEDQFVKQYQNGVQLEVNGGGSLNTLTDFALSALKQFSSFARRNNLAGQRYVDRILARFGVKPNLAISDRCQFLGATSAPVEISDVTATSAGSATVDGTEVANSLGDYTGKAYCASFNGHFSYETGSGQAEHGLFIVVATILPRMSYYGQVDPQTTQVKPLQFFTPEFDAFGSEALANKYIRASYDDLSSYSDASSLGLKPNGVFGYVPRYSLLKTQFDKLTGDFRMRSLRESMRCAHLFREIADPTSRSPLENNLEFEKFGPWLRLNYDRIFLQSSDEYEHFYCRFVFDAKLQSLMKPMYDELMMNDGDDEHNGSITMDINGRRF